MTAIYDCSVDSQLLTGMRLARGAIGRGELVVIPTDTVYGVAADAFDAAPRCRAPRREGPRAHVAAARADPGIPTLDAPRERGARGGAPARRGVLARRAHGHPARAAVAAVGPRRDARHRRAAHAGEPDRARAPRRDRPARGVEREPLRAAVGHRRPRTPREMLGDSVTVYLDGGPAGGATRPSASGRATRPRPSSTPPGSPSTGECCASCAPASSRASASPRSSARTCCPADEAATTPRRGGAARLRPRRADEARQPTRRSPRRTPSLPLTAAPRHPVTRGIRDRDTPPTTERCRRLMTLFLALALAGRARDLRRLGARLEAEPEVPALPEDPRTRRAHAPDAAPRRHRDVRRHPGRDRRGRVRRRARLVALLDRLDHLPEPEPDASRSSARRCSSC